MKLISSVFASLAVTLALTSSAAAAPKGWVCKGSVGSGETARAFTATLGNGLEIAEVWGGGEELDTDRFAAVTVSYEDGLAIVRSDGKSESGLVKAAELEISEYSHEGWLRLDSTPSSADPEAVWVTCE